MSPTRFWFFAALIGLALFGVTMTAHCQTTTPVSLTPPGTNPAVVQAATLPAWAGAGSSYGPDASPKFSGWAALALPVSQTAGAYSFTLYQALPVNGKVTISTTTGIDDELKRIAFKRGVLTLHGLGTIGVATTPTATTGAFAGGGGVMWRWDNGLTVEGFVVQNKAGAPSRPSGFFGFGWAWGSK